MARSGPVKTPSVGSANYKSGVSAGGNNWNTGVQNCQVNPMALAAGQHQKAAANYQAVVGNGYWAGKMSAMSVSQWKTPVAATVSKYTGSAQAGSTKWASWYQSAGMQVAQNVRNQAAQQRAAGTSGIDRAVAAINMMAASSKKMTGGQ